ncbi:5'-_3' exoribonuclease [Anaeramoeba flamelloides]|uniref:5'->3' exoribonuclease n=1 Tax=Anaeramoeba flamelloides TaxID=1746091 RepID=A0AAV7ZAJ6_9EUKA|nr:5'->3' exoribonuclease [Anaeramoeba flamelloides]
METVDKQMEFFIRTKMKSEWKHLKILYSGHLVPGEGEHKILDYIRSAKKKETYDPNTSHCFYGQDADLFFLSLITHVPNIVILRENFDFNLWRTQDLTYLGQKKVLLKKNLNLIFITLLREYLEYDLTLEFTTYSPNIDKNIPKKENENEKKEKQNEKKEIENEKKEKEIEKKKNSDTIRIIDDFVFLSFLIGNDFIPNLPNFVIKNGTFNRIIDLYREFHKEYGYITNHEKIDFENFENYLQEYIKNSKTIQKCILIKNDEKKTKENEKKQREKQKKEQRKKKVQRQKKEEKKKKDQNNYEINSTIDSIDNIKISENNVKTKVVTNNQKENKTEKKKENETDKEKEKENENEKNTETKKIKPPNYEEIIEDIRKKERNNYYDSKFEEKWKEEGFLNNMVKCYLEGLQWIYTYYCKGCPDWGWYYPFHYTPMIDDLVNLKKYNITENIFNYEPPIKPLVSLLSILPIKSSDILPQKLRPLLTDENSPLIEYLPKELKFDQNGKRFEWEWILLLPFIDIELFKKCIREAKGNYTEEEEKRNKVDSTYIYQYDENIKLDINSTLKGYPNLKNCQSRKDIYNFSNQKIQQKNENENEKENENENENENKKENEKEKEKEKLNKKLKLKENSDNHPSLYSIPMRAIYFNANIINLEVRSREKSIVLVPLSDYPDYNLNNYIDLFNKECYFDYPYLQRGTIKNIENLTHKLQYTQDQGEWKVLSVEKSSNIPFKKKKKNWYNLNKKICKKYLERHGIKLKRVSVLVTIKRHSYLKKDNKFIKVPLCFVIPFNYGKQLTLKRQARKANFNNQLKICSTVLNKSNKFLFSKVIKINKKAINEEKENENEKIKENDNENDNKNNNLYDICSKISKQTESLKTKINEIVSNQSQKWFTLKEISEKLKTPSSIILRICNVIIVDNKYTLGLQVVNPNIDICRFDYCRVPNLFEQDPEIKYEFSFKTLQLLLVFKSKFEIFFQALAKTSKNKINHKTLFENLIEITKTEDLCQEINQWVSTLTEVHKSPYLSKKYLTLDTNQMIEIEKLLIESGNEKKKVVNDSIEITNENNQKETTTKMQTQNYSNLELSSLVVPKNDEFISDVEYQTFLNKKTILGDRVINITSNISIPFGERGTIVATKRNSNLVQVIFDNKFISGSTLFNRIMTRRGFTMKSSSLINISQYKRNKTQLNSNN